MERELERIAGEFVNWVKTREEGVLTARKEAERQRAAAEEDMRREIEVLRRENRELRERMLEVERQVSVLNKWHENCMQAKREEEETKRRALYKKGRAAVCAVPARPSSDESFEEPLAAAEPKPKKRAVQAVPASIAGKLRIKVTKPKIPTPPRTPDIPEKVSTTEEDVTDEEGEEMESVPSKAIRERRMFPENTARFRNELGERPNRYVHIDYGNLLDTTSDDNGTTSSDDSEYVVQTPAYKKKRT